MPATIVNDALILPWSGNQALAPPNSRRAGVYGPDGLVHPSLLRRQDKPVRLFALEPADTADLPEAETIFGGHWFASFGHFLLETLSRAWFIRARPDLPVCWIGRETTVSAWQRTVLDLIGINNPIHILREPARVRRLHVAEPGFHIGRFFLPDQIAALGIHPRVTPIAGKRVWLSRSGLPDGLVTDEPAIEAELARNWIIYRPETHPVDDQLAMLADAERIAGFVGSAMHAFVLLRGLSARVDLFCRSGVLNENYAIIADAKAIDQHVHMPEVVPLGGKGNAANFRLVDPAVVADTLRRTEFMRPA